MSFTLKVVGTRCTDRRYDVKGAGQHVLGGQACIRHARALAAICLYRSPAWQLPQSSMLL
eukprot:5690801-Prymnesium_polylepis.1